MIRRWVRTASDWALRHSPIQRAYRKRASGSLAVLAYHTVEDRRPFERQLDFLTAEYTIITPGEAMGAFRDGSIPADSVLLTFDDGDVTFAENAWPALQARGLSAVVFVVPGLVESPAPYWWDVVSLAARRGRLEGELSNLGPAEAVAAVKRMPDDARRALLESVLAWSGGEVTPRHMSLQTLQRLASQGVSIGNHTWTHPILVNCDDATLVREVTEAHEYLVRAVGSAPYFAYPNGTFDKRAAVILERLGYEAAFLFDHGLVDPGDLDRFRVSRLRIGASDSIDRLAITLSGLHPAVYHARTGRGGRWMLHKRREARGFGD